jgi:hypothetical protein
VWESVVGSGARRAEGTPLDCAGFLTKIHRLLEQELHTSTSARTARIVHNLRHTVSLENVTVFVAATQCTYRETYSVTGECDCACSCNRATYLPNYKIHKVT